MTVLGMFLIACSFFPGFDTGFFPVFSVSFTVKKKSLEKAGLLWKELREQKFDFPVHASNGE